MIFKGITIICFFKNHNLCVFGIKHILLFIRIKSLYALNKETKTYHGNITILQTFAKAVCYHINCEADVGPGLFWTESSSQFCHISTRQKY